ncbi:THUMP domain-containing protein [Purpureocillium lavendulum]|uniref:THUMP domain-containing protein n=1 Tax=Purpureocillium lavendulum TaxID=1247861 RepID=A0AB34FRV8_9HYPO|nr:THUMP domain-containing protein [Purpureocillium lavendulum]
MSSMGDGDRKRKQQSGGADGGRASFKRSKGGSSGRWKTPHQSTKMTEKVDAGAALDVGDEGIWVTFARGMRAKAMREFKELCEEYGETLYDIKPPRAAAEADDESENDEDIEASIKKELEAIKDESKPKVRHIFSPVSAGIECLFFMKTMAPVKPGEFVLKICRDARDCPDPRQRKVKYINRLTPVFNTEKATEKGIVKVARSVLAPFFTLAAEEEGVEDTRRHESDGAACTYAIRHNIRNHTTFKSDEVIKNIASLVDTRHKVNLGHPDKVILVEIFQLFCGISVVDGKEWETLKRYNLNALYGMTPEEKAAAGSPTPVSTSEPAKASS